LAVLEFELRAIRAMLVALIGILVEIILQITLNVWTFLTVNFSNP
jgi:hypothetical protein